MTHYKIKTAAGREFRVYSPNLDAAQRTARKLVLDHIRRAMHFTDRNEALLWLNRQGLNTNEFKVICERCFKKRYERELA